MRGPARQTHDVLFAELVATSGAVTSTSSRSAKVAALADLLARLPPDEIAIAVSILTGAPRQGKIGVGWRGALGGRRAADQPTLTIIDVDATLDALAGMWVPDRRRHDPRG